MSILYFWFSALAIFLGISCADEKNPYKAGYKSSSTEAAKKGGDDALPKDGTPIVPGPVMGEQKPGSVPMPIPGEPAAKPVVPAQSLTGVQVICANPPALAKVQTELAVLCANGQVTPAFASALAAPYKGGANPPLVSIKSVDVNGVSEFIVLAVIEVPKTVAEVFDRRATLPSGTLTAGNAVVTQTVIGNTPPSSGSNLGSLDINFSLNVTVGIIKVANVSILQNDSIALNADKTVIASISSLKAGAADNTDDILSTSLSFNIQEGNVTKVISVNHQMVNNRGQVAAAAQTVLDIGKATMTDVYTKLTK
ncbi:MAG: hypothetical protein NTX25_04795 [Proteobacteria bacterium]|nr:hypothetical protein [Pseudomonadota bacterium]